MAAKNKVTDQQLNVKIDSHKMLPMDAICGPDRVHRWYWVTPGSEYD